jgi:hypothetical protein
VQKIDKPPGLGKANSLIFFTPGNRGDLSIYLRNGSWSKRDSGCRDPRPGLVGKLFDVARADD